MAFIPTVECAKVALRMQLFGQDVINTLWFSWQEESVLTIADLNALNVYMQGWWDAYYKLGVSEDLTLVEVTSTDQSSLTAPSVPYSFVAIPGDRAGASSPSSVCITVSFRTAERGRSSRGRNYVSGIRELDTSNNTVVTSVIDELENAYGQLIDNPPDGWKWVVVSHVNNGINRVAGLKQVVLDAVCVDAYVDSQRRRLTGRGS